MADGVVYGNMPIDTPQWGLADPVQTQPQYTVQERVLPGYPTPQEYYNRTVNAQTVIPVREQPQTQVQQQMTRGEHFHPYAGQVLSYPDKNPHMIYGDLFDVTAPYVNALIPWLEMGMRMAKAGGSAGGAGSAGGGTGGGKGGNGSGASRSKVDTNGFENPQDALRVGTDWRLRTPMVSTDSLAKALELDDETLDMLRAEGYEPLTRQDVENRTLPPVEGRPYIGDKQPYSVRIVDTLTPEAERGNQLIAPGTYFSTPGTQSQATGIEAVRPEGVSVFGPQTQQPATATPSATSGVDAGSLAATSAFAVGAPALARYYRGLDPSFQFVNVPGGIISTGPQTLRERMLANIARSGYGAEVPDWVKLDAGKLTRITPAPTATTTQNLSRAAVPMPSAQVAAPSLRAAASNVGRNIAGAGRAAAGAMRGIGAMGRAVAHPGVQLGAGLMLGAADLLAPQESAAAAESRFRQERRVKYAQLVNTPGVQTRADGGVLDTSTAIPRWLYPDGSEQSAW